MTDKYFFAFAQSVQTKSLSCSIRGLSSTEQNYKEAMSARIRISVTRLELSKTIYESMPTISREQSRKIVDDFLDIIIESLKHDEQVKIREFGTFKIHHKKERPGRNPKTNESFKITARRSLKFSASKHLIDRINNHRVQN